MKPAAFMLHAFTKWPTLLAVAAILACAPVDALAQNKPSADESDIEMKWDARFGEMAEVCGIDTNQRAKITAIDETREKALMRMCIDLRPQLDPIATKMRDPRITEAELERLDREYARIMTPVNEMEKKFRGDILAVLTPAQRTAWQEHSVLKAIFMKFLRARLSDQQKEQVKAMYAKLPKTAADTNEQLANDLSVKLMEVLRPEQQAVMIDPNKVIPRSMPASKPAK